MAEALIFVTACGLSFIAGMAAASRPVAWHKRDTFPRINRDIEYGDYVD